MVIQLVSYRYIFIRSSLLTHIFHMLTIFYMINKTISDIY